MTTNFDHFYLTDPALIEEIKQGFVGTYLRYADPAWVSSEAGQAEIHREIADKYNQCVRYIFPWLYTTGDDFRDKVVMEIGCGTGSKAAAFAQICQTVYGCDYSGPHVEAARLRTQAMGLQNVHLFHLPDGEFLEQMEQTVKRVDIVLLYAVLEHLTLEERLSTLRRAWGLLREGGLMLIAETPNRLLPWDYHTSRLPFFNMLPDDLALLYADKSPRPYFAEALRQSADPHESLARQGRGVSYHEFELALGDLDFLGRSIVADSYDVNILNFETISPDELILKDFIRREKLVIPPAFTRYWLKLILQKQPAGEGQPLAVPLTPTLLDSAGLAYDGEYTILTRAGSWVSYGLPPTARELVLGINRHPHNNGLCRIESDQGQTLLELDLYQIEQEASPHWHGDQYFRLELPADTTRVTATNHSTQAERQVWLKYLHAR